MTNASTSREPGEAFSGVDGNYNLVEDAVIPPEGEPRDFLLDSDDEEVSVGDWVRVIDATHTVAGQAVYVENVARATIYESSSGRAGRAVIGAWSANAPLNLIGIVHNGRMHTSINPRKTRKLNLTDEDTDRLNLAALVLQRARLDERVAHLQNERVGLSARITALERAIERAATVGLS